MEYLWYGLLYSLLGYCLEKVYARLTRSRNQLRRCFLVLPLCPVYGLAVTAMLLTNIAALPLPLRVAAGGLLATAVEYGVHWAYDRLLGVRFWDYSNVRLNIRGRVCLLFSVIWGLLAELVLRFVQPLLAGFVSGLPVYLLLLLLTAAAVDGVCAGWMLLHTHDPESLTLRAFAQPDDATSRWRNVSGRRQSRCRQ